MRTILKRSIFFLKGLIIRRFENKIAPFEKLSHYFFPCALKKNTVVGLELLYSYVLRGIACTGCPFFLFLFFKKRFVAPLEINNF